MAGENLDTFLESLQAVGALQAYAQKDGIESEFESIGWLIASLAELARYISKQRDEFEDAPKQIVS